MPTRSSGILLPYAGERARTVASEIMRRLPSAGHWLDIGSGTGLLGLALSSHADHVSLGDTSQGMLEVAHRNIADAGLNDRMDALFCDAEQWVSEVPSQEYDVIVSLMALHHMKDQRSVIRALVERARPGGAGLLWRIWMRTTVPTMLTEILFRRSRHRTCSR